MFCRFSSVINTKHVLVFLFQNKKAIRQTFIHIHVDNIIFVLEEKDKYMFCINYEGKPTEQLAKSFKKLNAPSKVIMKTKKLKSVLPTLKPTVPEMLRSAVVYKIVCPGCDASYVGETSRHLQQRLREHLGKSGTIRKHLENCLPSHTLENFGKMYLS